MYIQTSVDNNYDVIITIIMLHVYDTMNNTVL